MVRLTAGIAVLLASAAVAAGCASVDASTEKSAAAKPAAAEQRGTEGDYVTGSRLPRKANQSTQGVRRVSPEDWRNSQPPAPLKGN